MRSLAALIGVLVLLMVLGSTGAVQGEVCLRHVGCVRSNGGGIQIDGGSATPSAAYTP